MADYPINPLNVKLNPTCHLLALLGAHHILHVSRVGDKYLTNKLTKLLLKSMLQGSSTDRFASVSRYYHPYEICSFIPASTKFLHWVLFYNSSVYVFTLNTSYNHLMLSFHLSSHLIFCGIFYIPFCAYQC
jgi:hypothetical protein